MRPEHELKAVLRYIPHIVVVVNRWPDVTCLNPQNVQPSTFAARFRDAVAAACRYHQEEVRSLVDLPKLLIIQDKIVVSNRDGGMIVIGPADSLKVWNKLNEVVGAEVITPVSHHVQVSLNSSHDLHFLSACAIMCSHRIAQFANGVRFTNPTDNHLVNLEKLPELYDVNVIRNDDGSVIML